MRHHDIVAIEFSEYIEKIISVSRDGLNINQMIASIIDEDVDSEDAENFINELINCQFLISEIEPSVSGPEFISQILNVLENKLDIFNDKIEYIKIIDEKLKQLDDFIGNQIQKYTTISEVVQKTQIPYELKHLFQCDLITSTSCNTLDVYITNQVKETLTFLNKLKGINQNSRLEDFKKSFIERYEDKEISISTVLDPEIGIGYGANKEANDENPLIDDILLSSSKKHLNSFREIQWTIIDDIIQKKIIEANKSKNNVIKITDADFSFIPDFGLNDLPETISCITEIISENNNLKIKLSGAGGSAANLIARFCHSDPNIYSLVNEITDFESSYNSDKILAEIVHLPEARVGNILSRPDFREYEIPYLARSIKSKYNQINIDDIKVSIRYNKIILRSEIHNKEILPLYASPKTVQFKSIKY